MISSIFNYFGNKIRSFNEPKTRGIHALSMTSMNRKTVDKKLRELADGGFISISYDLIKLISEYFLNFTFDDCFCPSDWQKYFGTRSITLPLNDNDVSNSEYEERIDTLLSQRSPFTPTLLGDTHFLFYVPSCVDGKILNFCDFCKLTDSAYKKIGRKICFTQCKPELYPSSFFGWFLINKNTQNESEHFNKETKKYIVYKQNVYKQYQIADPQVAAIAAVTYFLKYKKSLTKEPMAVSIGVDSSVSIGCFQEHAPPQIKKMREESVSKRALISNLAIGVAITPN